MSSELTPLELRTWLEWAGSRLVAMPSGRIKPAEPKVIWPEYSQEKFQVLEFRGALSIRAAAPSAPEIPIVDEILTLPNVCAWVNTRRVLHIRSLVHPINGRYLYTWAKIARLLETNRDAVKRWHENGLREVIEKADRNKVCRIEAYLSEALAQSGHARPNEQRA